MRQVVVEMYNNEDKVYTLIPTEKTKEMLKAWETKSKDFHFFSKKKKKLI